MKRLLAFFTHKWVIGIIGLTALSLLIWFGANYIKFGADNTTLSTTTRSIIIGILWAIWLTWNISQWLVERRNNRQLLADMEQEDTQVSPDEERSQEELQAISERFREALSVLKKSRFKSRGGSKSLYQLPWYIIIGPPGAGKTTALVNSGLEFPLAQSHGKEALGGIGGTRNCDWWFTNDAVLIDTAGRYTTQDSHRVIDNNAWNKFLDMLKKYRRRRPINGAIVAISLQDLMVQTAEQRVHLAKTLRQRINELQQQLGIRFPIYLTFTKCDLVAGFSEFFANLSQAEREQVWGMSFNPEADATQGVNLDEFGRELNNLIERLNQRLLWRIHQERNIDKRSTLQGFPARIESLSEALNDFVKQTFAPNRYDVVPMVRGVYFTSATQEGSPIDRMMASVSANFGFERDMGRQQINSGKSFFLNRLLKDVVFPESELVGVNRKIESGMLWLRRLSFASLAAVFVGTLVLWTGSVTRNQLFMNDVGQNLAEYKAAKGNLRSNNADTIKTLTVLDPLYESTVVYDQESHPWLTGMGLYDDSVDTAAEALYQDQLNQIFLPSFARSIEQRLSRMSAKDDDLLNTLKVYLMLFTPEKRDTSAIVSYAEQQWQQQLPGQASKQEALSNHLQQLLQNPLPESAQFNERVVQRARQQLRRIPVPQRLYAQMKSQGTSNQWVDLYGEIGGDSESIFGIADNDPVFSMSQLYTKAGYQQADFSSDSDMMQQLAEDQWIYGSQNENEDFSEADREKISREIKQLYLNEYSTKWKNFLTGFRIARFKSTSEALENLSSLSDPVYSPLLAVSEIVAANTELTPRLDYQVDSNGVRLPVSSTTRRIGSAISDVASSGLANAYKPTVVDMRFEELQRTVKSEQNRPAKIQDYLSSIQAVHEFLAEIDSAPDANEAAFKAAKARFAGASGDAIKRLRVKANNAPAPMDDWLNDIADSTWALVLTKTKLHIDAVWKEQVYSTYQNSLSNRYPMVANRQTETPVLEFNNYFQPDGIEQKFVNSYIKPFVDTRRWKVRQLEGRSLAINSSTLKQLRRAENIRRAFFSAGENAAIKFRIEPTKLDSSVRLFALELGESRVPYSHGPRTTKHLDWVGGEDIRVRIIFEDLNETVHRKHFEGDWAWFRLLDASDMRSKRNNEYEITFSESGRNAKFRLIANSNINPFDNSLLRNYRCPQTL
ncbi:type VI secretion system membrane subunit TssM [Maricurvus nonylphenolicus]|uniref:type VI secretion system membrane subunit TssM n=1 Tax=Maricurvus nonylphenolicus TaxID=1008307 RepID=UPI0036F27FFD